VLLDADEIVERVVGVESNGGRDQRHRRGDVVGVQESIGDHGWERSAGECGRLARGGGQRERKPPIVRKTSRLSPDSPDLRPSRLLWDWRNLSQVGDSRSKSDHPLHQFILGFVVEWSCNRVVDGLLPVVIPVFIL